MLWKRTFFFRLSKEHVEIRSADPVWGGILAVEVEPVTFAWVRVGFCTSRPKAPEREPVLLKIEHEGELFARAALRWLVQINIETAQLGRILIRAHLLTSPS